jgi:predicted helicase
VDHCQGHLLLRHRGYRQKYADNLKRELARILFAIEFGPYAKADEKLAKLHLDYEQLKPWDLDFVETPGVPLSYRTC